MTEMEGKRLNTCSESQPGFQTIIPNQANTPLKHALAKMRSDCCSAALASDFSHFFSGSVGELM